MDKLYYHVRRLEECLVVTKDSMDELEAHFKQQTGKDALQQVIQYFVKSQQQAEDSTNEFRKNAKEEAKAAQDFEGGITEDEDDKDNKEDDEDSVEQSSDENSLGGKILAAFRHRKPKLEHDLAIAGWYVSPTQQCRDDVKENAKGWHQDPVTRLVGQWFGQDVSTPMPVRFKFYFVTHLSFSVDFFNYIHR